MQFLGGTANPTLVGQNLLDSTSNYFIGAQSQWVTNVTNFGAVEYQNLYAGVNMVFPGDPSELQYDFTVAAGADPSQIKMAFTGADQLSIDDQGNLTIQSGTASVSVRAPSCTKTSTAFSKR